jgi:hypothetical protein
LTKKEKTGFFLLCGKQAKINALIFLIFYCTSTILSAAGWGLPAVSAKSKWKIMAFHLPQISPVTAYSLTDYYPAGNILATFPVRSSPPQLFQKRDAMRLPACLLMSLTTKRIITRSTS